MKILGTEIPKGKKTVIMLDIARLHTRTKIEVPIIIQRSNKEGPCLLLTAGIHGNEINGIEIVRQIVAQKLNKPIIGTIICIPVMNVFAFLRQARTFPDGRDLNRVFPGTKTGSLASQFAHTIIHDIVPHVDYCIDFHTGGNELFNFSHIRIDGKDPETTELAKIFGTKFIMYSKNMEKSFRSTLSGLGVKVLLFEGGKSLDFDRSVTVSGIAGAKRIMEHLGMREKPIHPEPDKTFHNSITLTSSFWIRAKYSGLYRSKIQVGKTVTKGDVVGTISDPYGDFEKNVIAPLSGYLISNNQSPIVHKGDALIRIASND